MRWSVFVGLQILILLAVGGVVYTHQDRAIVLKEPPASLAEWYKPQNKRQVWLHTMFKLRRELLAVEIYANAQDSDNLKKWTEKFAKDYPKVSEMVPEWQSRVNLGALADLQKSVAENRYGDVKPALDTLNKSCTSCHTDYRAVTAAMYRAPNFADMKIEGTTALKSHMGTLSEQVNKIKIAFVDNRNDVALEAFSNLTDGMNQLGKTCGNCHKNNSQTYPSANMSQALVLLEQSLKTGALQDKGKALGTLAVMACAQCHGTHRISYDTRQLFTNKQNLRDLLKHSF